MSHLFPLVVRRPLCSGCSPVGNNICMRPVHSYRIQHVLEETHFLLLSCPSDEQEVGAREQEEERKNHALKLGLKHGHLQGPTAEELEAGSQPSAERKAVQTKTDATLTTQRSQNIPISNAMPFNRNMYKIEKERKICGVVLDFTS
ncbi:psychosine receptor isoform X2 [Equus przewalskii]|uniref:Psychosine receptor isoform X2 n=1 Tax=Equus przewalskii TaxID=9798 RepID=A0ABM4MAT6_EQUPR